MVNADEKQNEERTEKLREIEQRVATLTRLVRWAIVLFVVLLVCLLLPAVRELLGGLLRVVVIGTCVLLFIIGVMWVCEKIWPTQQRHDGSA